MADSHAAAHGAQKHQYHLVDPSPWPLLASLSAGATAAGMVLLMHHGIWWVALLGFLSLLFMAGAWWRDVTNEGEYQGHHTPIVQIGLRYGMVLFIASEVMFFAAFFWAFFDASLFPKEAIEFTWPPKNIHTFDPFDLPLLNTLILLLSGCTVTWAHHSLIHGDRSGLIKGLACTVVLGVAFTICQAFEYSHAHFGLTDGIYASVFYLATGFHGFHVIVGTIFLAVCLCRALSGHFKPDHHFGFEAAAWYWHFVDVVWLFLFVCVYIWGS